MSDSYPMSDEARESILAAMKLGLEAAKIKNKETYTPKKYRKGWCRCPHKPSVSWLGYIVLSVPLIEVRGFHQKIKRRHIIYLNDALSESEAQFVCAHELGHALLHNQINRLFLDSNTYFISREFEISADRFAVHLLHTDEEEEALTKVYQYTTAQISRMWGIPEALVEYRVNH